MQGTIRIGKRDQGRGVPGRLFEVGSPGPLPVAEPDAHAAVGETFPEQLLDGIGHSTGSDVRATGEHHMTD